MTDCADKTLNGIITRACVELLQQLINSIEPHAPKPEARPRTASDVLRFVSILAVVGYVLARCDCHCQYCQPLIGDPLLPMPPQGMLIITSSGSHQSCAPLVRPLAADMRVSRRYIDSFPTRGNAVCNEAASSLDFEEWLEATSLASLLAHIQRGVSRRQKGAKYGNDPPFWIGRLLLRGDQFRSP